MVGKWRKIKHIAGLLDRVDQGAFCALAHPETRIPVLPATPSTSWPKVASTLANTEVLAEGLKSFTPADLAPHVFEIVLEDEGGAGRGERRLIVVREIAPRLPMTKGSAVIPVHTCAEVPTLS
jgi:hypothetical protein